jgi:hypothetical protein
MLAGHEAQPGAEFSPVFEFVCIAHGGEQCSCDQRTDTFNPGQTLTALVLSENMFDLEVVVANALVYEIESFGHLAEHFAEKAAQLLFMILEYQRQLPAQGSNTLRNYNSILTEQATDFIG